MVEIGSVKFSRLVAGVFIMTVAIRFLTMLFSFNFRENTDVLRYRDWGRIAYLYGMADTYTTKHLSFGTLPNNQEPGSLYVINTMYNAHLVTSKAINKFTHSQPGSLQWVNNQLLNAFLRIPSIAGDMVIGTCIYLLIKSKKNTKRAIIGSSLFLFNPVVIYNSSFWGQMDGVNNALLFLSIYFLYKKRLFPVIFFYLFSLYIKLSLLFIFPFLFVVIIIIFRNQLKNAILYTAATILSIVLLTLPISNNPAYWLFQSIQQNAAGEMQNITAFALNFWWFFFKPVIQIGKPYNEFEFSEIRLLNSPLSQNTFFDIRLDVIAFLLFLFFSLPLLFALIKNNKSLFAKDRILLILSVLSLCAFLLLPRMHERYMYPLFPLLSAYVGIQNRFKKTLFLFSLMNLLNLYIVWHPFLPPVIPYWIVNNMQFQWIVSGITTATFLGWYFFVIKKVYLYENR